MVTQSSLRGNNSLYFLAYYVDQLKAAGSDSLFVWIDSETSELKATSSLPDILSSGKNIVTYEPTILINYAREHSLDLPKRIIDISILKKLLTGRPKGEVQAIPPWDFRSYILESISEESAKELFNYLLGTSEPNEVSLKELLESVCRGLASIYFRLIDALDKCKIDQTVIDREIAVANIFYSRELSGLTIKRELLESKLSELEDEYYLGLLQLRDEKGFRGNVFERKALANFFKENSTIYRSLDFDYPIDRYISNYDKFDNLAKSFRNLRRVKVAISTLLKLNTVSKNRLFAKYDTLGTVTGRITVYDPLIQQLRKIDRNIFCAEEGKILGYFDYREFEPRIISALSSDSTLIRLSENRKDLYEAISNEYFNGLLSRDYAKSLLLQTIYLAEKSSVTENILRLAVDIKSVDLNNQIQKGIEMFYEAIPKLSSWQRELLQEVKKSNSVKVNNLVPRYFGSNSDFPKRKERQAINHIIQGMGAVILKETILELYRKDFGIEILLPMHDAVLLQYPSENKEETESKVISIMEDTFNRITSSNLGRVTKKNFAK